MSTSTVTSPATTRRPSTPSDEPRCAPIAEARCATCGDRVVEINLVVQDDALTMLACSPCDTRMWLRDGWPVPIQHIIADVAETSMRFRRDITASC